MNIEYINTERLILKPITIDDASELFEIYSNPEVCSFFDINPFETLLQAKDQIDRWLILKTERKQYRYTITVDKKVIGTCGIYSIYWHQNRASIGYDLDRKYWNKGFMTEALDGFLKFISKEFKIHRIQGTVIPKHTSSRKVLEKVGFVFEGILHDYEKWKGEYVDLAMYSKILDED